MTNTPTQKKDTPAVFSFSEENLGKIESHIKKYPDGRQASAVLPLLDLGQRQNGGWISQAVIEEVARLLSLPLIRVQEVAAFYTMFNLNPVGKHHIQLCGTTPCWLRGAAELKAACMNRLNISDGGVSPDGKFSLVEVECLGACVNAPVVQINDDYYEDLTPDSFLRLIDDLANGKEVTVGSQIGRHCSAPIADAANPAESKKQTKTPRIRKVKNAE